MSFFNKYSAQDIASAQDYYAEFPIGEVYATIVSAEEAVSKSTYNNMLKIVFESDSGARITHYIVENDWFLSNIKGLCTSFDIPFGSDTIRWKGHKGIVVTKRGEPYNGVCRPKVSHFRSIKSGIPPAAPEKIHDTKDAPPF
jgi:hypothetical protein